MTKEQAIDNLKLSAKYCVVPVVEALEMAIKALEQQTINCNATTEEIAQSFKADVEAVKDYLPKCNSMEFPKTFDEFANDYGFTDDKEIYTNRSHLIPVFKVKQWLEHIEQQPIAEERYQDLVEYFGDDVAKCVLEDREEFKKWLERIKWHVHKADELARKLEQQPSDDCVSRQAVLKGYIEIERADGVEVYSDRVIPKEYVEALPPVTPASKQSEWYLRGGKFTCKNCEERALLKLTDATGGCREYNYYTSNFCPNCGAEMRGGENADII